MTFAAPWMLLGLAAVLVPIVIHLIGRQRAKVVRFAALDFLIATKRRTARRLQLRERLLLLARIVACLALVLAVAKPLASCRRGGPAVLRGPQAAVLVVDDSYVGGYQLDGRTLLARAVAEAQRILIQLGPEAEVAVVRASEGAELPAELSRDHLRLRDRLSDLRPSATPPDTSRALARAAQLLAGSSHRTRTVYLISPLTRAGFRAAEPPWGEAGPALVVVDLRGERALPNRAIVRASSEPEGAVGSRGIAVTAEIANFGPDPAKELEVVLRVEGRAVARGLVDLGPGERRSKRFLATLPEGRRAATVEVEIADRGLGLDDRRRVRAVLREQIHVLLVDGDARTTRHDDELFYLHAALRPGDRNDAGTDVESMTPEDLGKSELDAYDVIVLANVPALPAEQVARLAAWVRSGGGLWITAGDQLDAAAYEATMLPLLPQGVKDPIDTGWGATAADRASRALGLVKWETEHPIFAPFSVDAPGLAQARFSKIVLLGTQAAAGERKVLARFTNGAAALVEAALGAGRILLWTSTIDRDWNDLAIHPGYLPLVQGAILHLARRDGGGAAADHLVGRSVVLPIGDATRIEVRAPDGGRTVFTGERLAGRRNVRFGATEQPGIYEVTTTVGQGTPTRRDELAFAINPDPRAADLSAIAAADLPVSGRGGGEGGRQPAQRVELWHGLAAALLVLLLLEALLVQR
ncbi:MAG: BatA domain-containing protein [Kofleriaceae bacterium]|nr:BatA domain-containing protein [Kofleriaceae bacterium]MBP6838226.1 BatA domain-containing protein [Kofleriaceae bacterium]